MVPMKRADGTRSRTMNTMAWLAVLVAVEGSMAAFQVHIPREWLWVYPVAHTALVAWIAYLRATTTQPLGG